MNSDLEKRLEVFLTQWEREQEHLAFEEDSFRTGMRKLNDMLDDAAAEIRERKHTRMSVWRSHGYFPTAEQLKQIREADPD